MYKNLKKTVLQKKYGMTAEEISVVNEHMERNSGPSPDANQTMPGKNTDGETTERTRSRKIGKGSTKNSSKK